MLVQSDEIVKIFKKLNSSGLSYILLRNINKELPGKLQVGKDIDLLVHKHDEYKLQRFFQENNYQVIDHPFKNDVFLYGVDKFEFKYNNNNNNILFDLNFQLAVRSLDAGQWVPLDQAIQKSAWNNIRFEKIEAGFGYWTLGIEDEFIMLVSRSIFDKKTFHKGYIDRIEELLPLVDTDDVISKFRLIFFNFTTSLWTALVEKNFKDIIHNYIKFKEY